MKKGTDERLINESTSTCLRRAVGGDAVGGGVAERD